MRAIGARLEAPTGLCDLAVAGGTTVATISSLLADHVTLQVRSVDRLFLQGYVPRLMCEGQVIRFLLDRGFPIPSPAVLGKIGRDYVNRVNAFIAENEIPVVRFVKGDVKEEIAREQFTRAEREGRYGVVMVGVAQEKTSRGAGGATAGRTGTRTSSIAASRSSRTTTTSTSATRTGDRRSSRPSRTRHGRSGST